jgi:hypothetical protein
MKKELTPESTPKSQMHAMIDAAEYFNSDLTQFIGRDDDGKIFAVGVVARGAYAKRLARFLKKLDKEPPLPARAPCQAPDGSDERSFKRGES